MGNLDGTPRIISPAQPSPQNHLASARSGDEQQIHRMIFQGPFCEYDCENKSRLIGARQESGDQTIVRTAFEKALRTMVDGLFRPSPRKESNSAVTCELLYSKRQTPVVRDK